MNELQKLIDLMLEDRLTGSDAKRLQTLLENDPEARRAYAEQCQLHARLTMDPSIKDSLKAEAPIDLDDSGDLDSSEASQTKIRRFPSYIGIVAAASAISFVGVITVLNFSTQSDHSGLVASSENGLSPQEAYDKADFPDSGNLKRPPTNFAVITPQSGQDKVSFNRDIRPILSDNCFQCHGPDANAREAELRLDIEANAFVAHGEFEPAIVRGDPESSPIYQRIMSPLKSDIMPPPETHKSLTESQKDLVGQWIEEGAKWEAHWAFIKPEAITPPNSTWGNGPIDAFLLAKMDELELSPNQEADRPTLARRLSLDLTGLPLSPEEVDQFAADTSPDAYEKLVDRLLDSPAYGEHQARFWLDAARYSDTHGLHLDNYREIWPYRDWVVNAFNDNKPFDAFVVEQIAGDLLPNPTPEQRIATGFNRCNPTTSEGGAIDEEYRAVYAKDRVETTATVFMGLTMGCASCHDHKFDPLTQTDFYQFAAFFNNIDGPIMDGNAKDTKPIVVIPKSQHVQDWNRISPRYESLGKQLEKLKEDRKSKHKDWLASDNPQFPADFLNADLSLLPADTENSDSAPKADLTFETGDSIELPNRYNQAGENEAFTITFSYKTPKSITEDAHTILSKFDGDRGWRVSILNGTQDQRERYRLRFELIHSLKDRNLISITTQNNRRAGSPSRGGNSAISISYDGSGKASGISIGSPRRQIVSKGLVIDQLGGSFYNDAPLRIHDASEGDETLNGLVSKIDFFDTTVLPYSLDHLGRSEKLKKTFNKTEDERSKREANELEAYYFDMLDPEHSKTKQLYASLESEYRFYYDQSIVSLAMKEKDEDAFAFILERGEYDKKRDKVFPQLPKSLGSLPETAPRNRLSLANWLVDADNPLTARVTVNRIWQNLFGTGLVKTSEDFGVMGENPTHPELLDWLAIDFRKNGWNMKAFTKQIVTSAVYKQDSKISKEKREIDPENRFLARGPRYRLDGETLRDQALFVSGSLRDEQGGPPVRPYQPTGIWDAVAYSGSNTRYYSKDEGDALYRRSLYTFWKRTAPPPNMVVFDAPSRESCSVRRDRTNTPLQALTLMNDPQYVEAARQLAQHASSRDLDSIDERIVEMYRRSLGTAPPESHQKVLKRSYSKFQESFSENPSAAEQLISTGDSKPDESLNPVELASLTMVANQIMNLDSFINKY